MKTPVTLIVFSHLRWNFVWQRPQQLLSRLARHYRVIVVEEPVFQPCAAVLRRWQPAPGIEVVRPHTPLRAPGFHDAQLPMLRALVRGLVSAGTPHLAWFYTPMALPLLQELAPAAVIYDCMDELAAFQGAPRQLAQRENALLKVADVVFAGGGSLYRARRERHANVHCFPSSVDAQHFAPRPGPDTPADHPLQATLPRPRLGYYGVLDERIDYGLLAAMAEMRPDWQIVLLGPTAKVDAERLPRAANLHYPGRQSYASLPAFLAGWDVCLLPFARNAATRYISPTKVLEYMAAARPIVSTPVADIEEPYGDVISIAAHPQAFVDACEQALHADAALRARRAARMRAIVAATSWDDTVAAMRARIDTVLERRANAAPAHATPVNPARTPDLNRVAGKCHAVIVLGAGPTGLAAAWHLPPDTLVLERHASVGGWCRSVHDKGFTFDHAGHIMFSADPYVLAMYQRLLGDNLHWQEREAWIWSHGVHTRYPFQGALHGLPPRVLKDCLIGAIEARFGALQGGTAGNDPVVPTRAPRNFEEFILTAWGRGVAEHFALPYNRKLWTVPLTEIETSWLAGRVPLPDLAQMIEGALEPAPRPMGPNARFGYPLRGGFGALMEAFVPQIPGRIECEARVIRIDPRQRLVLCADGRRFRYRQLIATMPLPELVAVLADAVPPELARAAAALRQVAVRVVNLGVGRPDLSDKHWIYYPEDPVFHRVFLQGNASPHCSPPGGFGLTCEITYGPAKPLPCDGTALIERCLADCVRVGLLRPDDRLLTAHQLDMPCAYVIYDHARAANVAQLREWLGLQGIVLAGRYAEWEYYNSDHAFLAGRRAAATVLAATTGARAAGDAA